jgi:hypothetical protein
MDDDDVERKALIVKLRIAGAASLVGAPILMYMGFRDGETWSVVAAPFLLLGAIWMLIRAKYHSQLLASRGDDSSASVSSGNGSKIFVG